VSIEAVEVALQHSIKLICLPAHSSHTLQPLDVGVYCHVKTTCKKTLATYYERINFHNLEKDNFSKLLKQLYESGTAFTRLHDISGFHQSDLFPLNKQNISHAKLQIAQTFNATMQPSSSTLTPMESALSQKKDGLEAAMKAHFSKSSKNRKKECAQSRRRVLDGIRNRRTNQRNFQRSPS
jgi:hypothetical protein